MGPQETPPVEIPAPPSVTPPPPPSVFSSPLLWMLIVITILMIIGIAFYYFVSSRQHITPIVVKPSVTAAPTTIATSPTAEPTQSAQASPSATASDLPPLYMELKWKPEVKGDIPFRTSGGDIVKLSGTRVESEDLKVKLTDFENYYKSFLKSAGWNEVEVAGETPDELFGYEKGQMYFRFGASSENMSGDKLNYFVEYN